MNTITDRLRVAVLPLDIAPADKEANLRAVEAALETLPPGTDIVVLPELFTTGYIDSREALDSLAERNTQGTIDRVRSWADRCGCAFCGSFLASTPPHIYNRAFFIEPNGDETYYDKAHLFSISDEARLLHSGSENIKPVRFRGWNVAMIVCYDLRFPVWCRNINLAYDILLVPANWPQSREYAWSHLLIARAIENQAAVVGADRGGEDRFGIYDGMTRFYNALGMPVGGTAAKEHQEDNPWFVADFHKADLYEYRRKFPVSNDADSFSVGNR